MFLISSDFGIWCIYFHPDTGLFKFSDFPTLHALICNHSLLLNSMQSYDLIIILHYINITH